MAGKKSETDLQIRQVIGKGLAGMRWIDRQKNDINKKYRLSRGKEKQISRTETRQIFYSKADAT